MTSEEVEAGALCAQMAKLGLIGRSPAMLALYSGLRRAGPASDLSVLITGETGTGKELIARAVHRLDPKRAAHPFVPVNCVALSSGVADSELFGHRRGSFTGATEEHRGWFRSADKGVLFLDEIADLDLSLQGKLLRVLQEGTVRPVGSDGETSVDVRVVAATNQDLASRIAEGCFRLDLFHRLAVLEIQVPCLSERTGDVLPLVEHFVMKYTPRGGNPPSISPAFACAIGRAWLPGNVRQLENLVRRMLAEHPQATALEVDMIPGTLSDLAQQPEAAADCEAAAVCPIEATRRDYHDAWSELLAGESSTLAKAMAICEKNLLVAALASSRGNQSLAASMLGITPRSVYNKIRRHGLLKRPDPTQ